MTAGTDAAPAPEGRGTGPTEGLYVYAVTRGAPDELGAGIDGAPLERVTAHGLTAVVHRHGATPYSGPDDDVRRWVVEHSDVVDRLWQAAGAVLPMSFNVIVAGTGDEPAPARLAAWLAEHAERLDGRLDQLAGRGELQVEIGIDQHEAGAGDARLDALRAELESRPPGVRRLLTKRLEQLEREVTDALADELYPDLRRRLATTAEEVTETRRAHPPAGVVPVLAVALLVPLDGVDRVGHELARIRDEQPAARIRFVGPWPPFSFAEVPPSPQDAARDGGRAQAGA
ncbi:GvpL/GvpF family gas vesicle protein [Isoptericola sp. NPDC057391]|uniref:GvpL/GvpF family gas vesicle protein n=1 Tax=Isoptericola sp. NPDC057391 TaxID=3346117 RepID=UPI003632B860